MYNYNKVFYIFYFLLYVSIDFGTFDIPYSFCCCSHPLILPDFFLSPTNVLLILSLSFSFSLSWSLITKQWVNYLSQSSWIYSYALWHSGNYQKLVVYQAERFSPHKGAVHVFITALSASCSLDMNTVTVMLLPRDDLSRYFYISHYESHISVLIDECLQFPQNNSLHHHCLQQRYFGKDWEKGGLELFFSCVIVRKLKAELHRLARFQLVHPEVSLCADKTSSVSVLSTALDTNCTTMQPL